VQRVHAALGVEQPQRHAGTAGVDVEEMGGKGSGRWPVASGQ
jgi:hypothetical protein